jgi:hypothetical protein
MDIFDVAKQLEALNPEGLGEQMDSTFCNELINIQNWNVSYSSGTLQSNYQASPVNAGDTILNISVAVLSADMSSIYCSGSSGIVGGQAPSPGSSLAAITSTMLFNPANNGTTVISWATGTVYRSDGSNCPFLFQKQFSVE